VDPPQYRDALLEAEAERAALAMRIPALHVQVDPREARVVLDGRVLSASEIDTPFPVDPGKHEMLARAEGHQETKHTVTLAEGAGVTRVVIELPPVVAPPPPAPASPRPRSTPARAMVAEPIYWPAGVALALGLSGMTVGTVCGIVAASTVEDVRSRCIGNECLASDGPLIERAGTLADVSTVTFIVGGIGVGAGVVLAILPPTRDMPATPRTMVLQVGPNAFTLRGRF
jgi:hypothetical protein